MNQKSGEERDVSKLVQFFEKVMKKTSDIWDVLVDYYHLLRLVRFSIFIAIVVFLFMVIPQGKEALIAMLENAEEGLYVQRNYFIVCTVLLALMSWYYARVLYKFEFKHKVTRFSEYLFFKRHFPRWLGSSMIIVPAMTIYSLKTTNAATSFYLLIAAVLFLIFVYSRKKVFRLEKSVASCHSLSELKPMTKFVVIGFLVINWLLLYLFAYFGQVISVEIGATAVVMLAMATLVSVGSSITYLGESKGVPLLLIIILVAIITSLISDNHKIRLIKKNEVTTTPKTSLTKHFTEWLAIREKGHDSGEKIPVFFVATEGGGIRAAYWTAIVLGHLKDKYPEFSKHIYAISGVSGGSLGASVFSALLSQADAMDQNQSQTECSEDKNNYFCRSKRILKEDFLAPTVANMMFSDSFQRFCFLCDFDDRAKALEVSWERAWQKEWQGHAAVDVFNKPFHDIWLNDKDMNVPTLFLNSTVVETGQRSIATPLNLGDSFSKTFNDALDTFTLIGESKTMCLSTTILTSARFTYVSPAGTLERKDKPVPEKKKDTYNWIRLVDGGYFENSGATAITEILNKIEKNDTLIKKIRPIVIHISNEQGYPDREDKDTGTHSQASFMSEVLSPLKAIFAVRGGKGQQARLALENKVADQESYIHFSLPKAGSDDVKLPLGWMLSKRAQEYMDECLISESLTTKIDLVGQSLKNSRPKIK